MGGAASTHNCKPQSTVPAGKIRICVAGYWYSPYTGRAHKLANHLAAAYPETFDSWFYWGESHGAFYRYLQDTFDKVPFPEKVKGHASSPFVWLEVAKSDASGTSAAPQNAIDGDNAVLEIIGGNAQFQQWIRQHTAAADGSSPFEPQTLSENSEAETAAGVAKAPKTLFFKKTEELAAMWDGMSLFGDMSHVEKYGPQTAAEKQQQ